MENQNSGFGTSSGSDMGNTGIGIGTGNTGTSGATGTTGTGFGSAATATDTGVCPHCGQSVGGNKGLEQFLGRIGISDDMINNLKSQMQNVDVEEYLNTAREYLKNASGMAKNAGDKASTFAKENPGKVAAGVAVLAVGAGLLINAMREH